MFLQYRKEKDEYKLIAQNNRLDDDNEAILKGDYLDKSTQYTEDGREILFEMPSRDELLKNYIFPDWQEGDILIVAQQPLRYPKLSEDRQTLVEMTKEEICATGDLNILREGEKWEDGKIITVEKPNSKYLTYIWNRNTFSWELTTTKEELMLKRKDLILEYKKLKEEIEALQEFEEEFESDNTIELLREKMEIIKSEINELLGVIKKLK